MTSLFLTGASGFLGSGVLSKLNPDNFNLITLLSRSTINLPPDLAKANNVKVINASITDVRQYASSFNNDTQVVHLAAMTGKASPKEYFAVNTEGTRTLIDAAKEKGVSNFLFISSIAVSFSDRKGYFYAESKEQAENLLKDSGLNYCIFRPTVILGPGSTIWSSFKKLASSAKIVLPGSGKVKMQPIYIDDMASLILDVVTTNRFTNDVLEIGGPETVTMDEFVRRIHYKLKKDEPRIIHLPLGMLVGTLRIFEKVFPSLLPVNSGQFSSFRNDVSAKNNDLLESKSASMKDLDAMLDLLNEGSDQPVYDNPGINIECNIFSRYLMGQLPDKYIQQKYAESFSVNQPFANSAPSKFNKLLLRLATIHPLLTRAVDIYSRFFLVDSDVRKRLVLLLAILESWAPSYARLDSLKQSGNIIIILAKLVGHGLLAVLSLVLVTPFLLPAQILMRTKKQ